jgi:hypothetical protein
MSLMIRCGKCGTKNRVPDSVRYSSIQTRNLNLIVAAFPLTLVLLIILTLVAT